MGPIGGMAANILSEALGVKADPQSIEQAIHNATPQQLLELKKAEKDFEVQMKELDVDVYALQTKTYKTQEKHLAVIGLLSF